MLVLTSVRSLSAVLYLLLLSIAPVYHLRLPVDIAVFVVVVITARKKPSPGNNFPIFLGNHGAVQEVK